jgi:hypothetical protein
MLISPKLKPPPLFENHHPSPFLFAKLPPLEARYLYNHDFGGRSKQAQSSLYRQGINTLIPRSWLTDTFSLSQGRIPVSSSGIFLGKLSITPPPFLGLQDI